MLHRERETRTKIAESEITRDKTYVARTHQIWPSTCVEHVSDTVLVRHTQKNAPSADTFETRRVCPRHWIVFKETRFLHLDHY